MEAPGLLHSQGEAPGRQELRPHLEGMAGRGLTPGLSFGRLVTDWLQSRKKWKGLGPQAASRQDLAGTVQQLPAEPGVPRCPACDGGGEAKMGTGWPSLPGRDQHPRNKSVT